jgi:hypothetical protein
MSAAGPKSRNFFFSPGRLWSLGDMLRFYGKPFVDASELMGQLFIAVLDPNVKAFGLDARHAISSQIDVLSEQLEILELRMTKISAQRFKTHINIEGISPAQCAHYLHETASRLKDELESKYLIYLSSDEVVLYEVLSPPFGEEVQTKFLSAIYDIEEASKCYALERYTASTFHSIRSLESGIRAISRCLSIADPTRASGRNWGAMLKSIKDEIDRRWPGSSSRMLGDGEFFDTAYAALAAMQNPWRNATMHLDQKYTPDEARHITDVVKGFMKKVASRMDEDGKPLA